MIRAEKGPGIAIVVELAASSVYQLFVNYRHGLPVWRAWFGPDFPNTRYSVWAKSRFLPETGFVASGRAGEKGTFQAFVLIVR